MKAQNSLKREKSVLDLAILTHNTTVRGLRVGAWEKSTTFPDTSATEPLEKSMNLFLSLQRHKQGVALSWLHFSIPPPRA